MHPSIEKLLILASEFAKYGGPRQRINYESQSDREFCNEILIAVKEAVPILRRLVPPSALPATTSSNPESRVPQATEASKRPINEMARSEPSEMAYYAAATDATTQSAGPETPDQSPSNGPSAEPGTEHSTHNPTEPPKTDGTAEESGRKPGSARKLSSGLAKLNAARKAAALARKKQSAGESE
jgi:hypothetical protein